MIPIFAPPVAPSPGTQHSPVISLDKMELGDGYSLATPRGLNHIRSVVELRWNGLSLDDMQTIRAFFEERGGYKPFLFQPYGDTLRRWTCEEWSAGADSPWTFRATLRESFGFTTGTMPVEPGDNYLTDDNGNVLTDDAGNLITAD